MIGIYKITSPSNRVYIGQSINIELRWKDHKGPTNSGSRLHNSFKKHGAENHAFEVIEECEVEKLNERERYWQDHYRVLSPKGLNCKLTKTDDKSGYMSINTKNKLVEYHKNKSEDTEKQRRQRISKSVKSGISTEKKQYWSDIRKGRPVLQPQRDKISNTHQSKTDEEKAEISRKKSLGQQRSKAKRAETIASRTPEQKAAIVLKFQETLRLKKEAKLKEK